MLYISLWNLKSFNRHYLIVLRTVTKPSDIYITPFILNNPKGLCKPWNTLLMFNMQLVRHGGERQVNS